MGVGDAGGEVRRRMCFGFGIGGGIVYVKSRRCGEGRWHGERERER